MDSLCPLNEIRGERDGKKSVVDRNWEVVEVVCECVCVFASIMGAGRTEQS